MADGMALWLPALARLRLAIRFSTSTMSWATRIMMTMVKTLKMPIVAPDQLGASVHQGLSRPQRRDIANKRR